MKTFLWTIRALVLAPALLLVARLRRPARPTRIVIIQLGKLGDLLCTTPMFRALKEAHPDWEVHVVCREQSGEALKGNPLVTAMYPIDRMSRSLLIRRLRMLRPMAVINCMPGAFASVLGLFAMAPVRINTFSSDHGLVARLLTLLNTLNVRFAIRTWTHAHYMKLVEPLGALPVTPIPDFVVSPEAHQSTRTWRAQHGIGDRAYVVCAITAGNAVKEWPEDKFAALACAIRDSLGMKVVFSTADPVRVASLCARLRDTTDMFDASRFSLAESAALYGDAAAFVSADTGPLYLAYATGVPLVVMIGPVHPEEQIPRSSSAIVHIAPPVGCDPWVFVSLTPRVGTEEQMRCAKDIPVESVFEGVKTVLRVSR